MHTPNDPKNTQNPTLASDLGQIARTMPKIDMPHTGGDNYWKAQAIWNGIQATGYQGRNLADLLALLTSQDRYAREAAKKAVRELVKIGDTF